MEPLELSAAQGVIGLAVVQTLSMYRSAAPSITELRDSDPHDFRMKQLLLDADLFGGVAVVLIGGITALLSQNTLPLLLAVCGLGLVSCYYRSVLASGSPAPESASEA